MRPVARQMVVLVSATGVSLAALLAYFYWPGEAGGFVVGSSAAPEWRAESHVGVPPVEFVDVTAEAGIDFTHVAGQTLRDIRQVMSPGLGLADLNGDGMIDLVMLSGAPPGETGRAQNVIYLNQGQMRFEALPGAGGANSGEWAMGCAIADYDADGDQDLYVTALGPNRLYRNDGHARFQEVAVTLGVADPRWSTGAAFADYDLDGDLDLYVANYVAFDESRTVVGQSSRGDRDEPPEFTPYVFPCAPDALFRNDGGAFTDATEAAGIVRDCGKGMAVLFADLTHDRLPDLLVVNDVSRNAFYKNVDGTQFEDVSVASGLADPRSGMGVALGDFDNDGAFDLFSTHWQDESNVLYRNLCRADDTNEVPLFEDISIQVGLAAPSMGTTGWGASWADFDLDGDLDLLVVNGYTSPAATDPSRCIGQRAMLFLNEGGRFVDRTQAVGLDTLGACAARGAGIADLDDNGTPDIVIAVNNGPVHVFRNQVDGGRWLKIIPVGGIATGAIVTARCGDFTQQRMLVSGSSYLSSEPPVACFGLGDRTVVEQVVVRWPDGVTRSVENVPSNQTIMVPKP